MDLFLSRFAFIFLIYAVVSFGYINEILSCQMRRFLQDSRYFRHIIGILMVFVFIMLEGGWSLTPGEDALAPNNWSSGHVWHTLILAIGIYGVFLFSSKSRLAPNLIFFVLVLTIYFLNTYRNYQYSRRYITDEENARILRGTIVLFVITLIVLMYGMIDYALYQLREYGSAFRWNIFLFGSYRCKHEARNGL